MSATRQPRERSRGFAEAPPTNDVSRLRARRREARRRRRLARLDLGIGVVAALVLLLATPGLAISAVLAMVILAVCMLSVVLERRRRRAAGEPDTPRERRAGRKSAENDPRPASGRVARDRRRSVR